MKVAVLLGAVVLAALAVGYVTRSRRRSAWHQLSKQQRTLYPSRPTPDARDWQGKFDPTLH